jgi:excisionase family DNA binding protein
MFPTPEVEHDSAGPPEDGDPWMTTTQAAARAQVCTATLWRAVRLERLRAVRVGKRWRFRKSWIDGWLLGLGR